MKGQLTAQADLLKEDLFNDNPEELDEEELEVLQNAGLISKPPGSKRKQRKFAGKHIIFAEDEAEGISAHALDS